MVQRINFTTGYLLDYPYFGENYKVIAINLNKQQVLNADPKAIIQINFTGNLGLNGNTQMFFILEKVKENTLDFLTMNCESITNTLHEFYSVLI